MNKQQTVVVKFGGNALNEETATAFASAIQTVVSKQINVVIVHGGGPQINELLGKLNIESKFINGLRYTDQSTLSAAEMVLAGQVNKMLSKKINQAGVLAIGMSGTDANLLTANALTEVNGEPIDLGYVGQVSAVNIEALNRLLAAGMTPVIAPLALGTDGKTYNINADLAAADIAAALEADALILMTNIPGLMDAEGQVIHQTNKTSIEALIADGTIHGGMIPKTQAALDVIGAVKHVKIIDGRDETTLAKAIAGESIGTTISA